MAQPPRKTTGATPRPMAGGEGEAGGARRRGVSRPVSLAQALSGCIAPALRKQGFGEAEIVTDWPQIVGARLAAVSAPVRLVWPPGAGRRENAREGARMGAQMGARDAAPATLCVRVEGAFALELQHLAPLVLERVNARLGWRCVARLQLLQGPLPRPRAAARPAPAPGAADAARAAALAAGVEDAALREALTRLGARVLSGVGATKAKPSGESD